MNAFRPGEGSVSSEKESNTVPWDALDVSISGTSAVTLTASARAPTSSFKSRMTNCCVPTRMPSSSVVLNPSFTAVSLYEPGSSAAKSYSPLSFPTIERERFVASFVSVTATPGITAPPASLTEPRKPPWKPWLNAPRHDAENNTKKRIVARTFIVPSHRQKRKGHTTWADHQTRV